MKTILNELTEYLEDQPLARERKNKDRAIVNLLLRRYPGIARACELGVTSKEEVTNFVKEHNSYDRGWRKVTGDRPDLRGKDYDEKAELEDRKLEELGNGGSAR